MKKSILFLIIFTLSAAFADASYYQTELIINQKTEAVPTSLDDQEFMGTVIYEVPDALGVPIILYVDVYRHGSINGPAIYFTHSMRVSVDGVMTSGVFYDGYLHATSASVDFSGVTIYYSSYIQSGSFVVPDSAYPFT